MRPSPLALNKKKLTRAKKPKLRSVLHFDGYFNVEFSKYHRLL
ncbi:hypothetical protein HMPREF0454_03008 [Hafnia alvei ATCC 51873]|uniref:Uncharacterized protein n=1 Tax=Hafnia alvei ATCC 51873 TaxID=1002364 RepID=G9Y8Y6_HAFAL|nr:hypothetical protein HMPREF0454_03008 [Hafnia alvei ATCC 51873]